MEMLTCDSKQLKLGFGNTNKDGRLSGFVCCYIQCTTTFGRFTLHAKITFLSVIYHISYVPFFFTKNSRLRRKSPHWDPSCCNTGWKMPGSFVHRVRFSLHRSWHGCENIDSLLVCIFFPLKNVLIIWRHPHCCWRAPD